MGNGSRSDMFDDNLHFRVIWKASILLLEPEMCWMEVYSEGGRTFCVFLKDVGGRFD